MKGGIGDNIVLEETSEIELREVITDIAKYKLRASEVLAAPCNIIRSNIVTSRREQIHGLLKIVYATRIVKIGFCDIVPPPNPYKTEIMGLKEFWKRLKDSCVGLEPCLNRLLRCKELSDILCVIQEILIRLEISL